VGSIPEGEHNTSLHGLEQAPGHYKLAQEVLQKRLAVQAQVQGLPGWPGVLAPEELI